MSPRQGGLLETGTWDETIPEPNSPSFSRTTKRYIDYVRPSFLTRAGARQTALHPTAFLDGLRGFAAFLVYLQHHQLWAHAPKGGITIMEAGFGANEKYYFAAIPFIRTFFTGGHFAVTVFFVISGYVLSRKPLQYIHSGEQIKLSENLASALFRRWLRLFIPVIVTTFVFMTVVHTFGIWTDHVWIKGYRAEVWNWYCEIKNFTFVFGGGGPLFSYNYHVWSIPVEFRGSIIIYTASLAFSRCTRNTRLWCEVGLIFYFLYIVDGWYGSLFMAGMLLCDLDLLASAQNLPKLFYKLEPLKELIFLNLFIASIYLGGVPSLTADYEDLKKYAGWKLLSVLKPQAVFDYKWFYLFWASLFLVSSVPRLPYLLRFFESPTNQYLGRISYAFYLVHGPVLWVLGDRLYASTGFFVREDHKTFLKSWIGVFPISGKGPLGLELAFWAPQLVLLPVTLWIAEVVTALVDQGAVKFAGKAYRGVVEEEEERGRRGRVEGKM